ncbi:MAG: hypothetical protein ACM3XN_10655 [Chloroflexota bacterium]
MSTADGGCPATPRLPSPLAASPRVIPWAPNNPWASPWPVQCQPSVDFVTFKLDGLEIGVYRFQGGTLPHELHVVVPRAEIERRKKATDGSEEIHRTVLSSITIAHAPRYPWAGGERPEGEPEQPAQPAPPAPPALPGNPRRPFYGQPAPPGQAPQPVLPRAAAPLPRRQ